MNNLEPRAKIGDVVIFKVGKDEDIYQGKITGAEVRLFEVQKEGQTKPRYQNCWLYHIVPIEQVEYDVKSFVEDSILKNLTTNVSYEESDD